MSPDGLLSCPFKGLNHLHSSVCVSYRSSRQPPPQVCMRSSRASDIAKSASASARALRRSLAVGALAGFAAGAVARAALRRLRRAHVDASRDRGSAADARRRATLDARHARVGDVRRRGSKTRSTTTRTLDRGSRSSRSACSKRSATIRSSASARSTSARSTRHHRAHRLGQHGEESEHAVTVARGVPGVETVVNRIAVATEEERLEDDRAPLRRRRRRAHRSALGRPAASAPAAGVRATRPSRPARRPASPSSRIAGSDADDAISRRPPTTSTDSPSAGRARRRREGRSRPVARRSRRPASRRPITSRIPKRRRRSHETRPSDVASDAAAAITSRPPRVHSVRGALTGAIKLLERWMTIARLSTRASRAVRSRGRPSASRTSAGSTPGCFHGRRRRARARVGGDREPFTIVMPPPNVTAVLHMGHGLNNTVQDVIIRWRAHARRRGAVGSRAPTTPASRRRTSSRSSSPREGKTRFDLGRERSSRAPTAFVDGDGRRRSSSSCARSARRADWTRTAYTLSPELSRAVREAFVRLYERGLDLSRASRDSLVPALSHVAQRRGGGVHTTRRASCITSAIRVAGRSVAHASPSRRRVPRRCSATSPSR